MFEFGIIMMLSYGMVMTICHLLTEETIASERENILQIISNTYLRSLIIYVFF